MSEMIERSARAICARLNARDFAREAPTLEAFVNTAWPAYADAARAAIEAMRTPSLAMEDAGETARDVDQCGVAFTYRAMIDAALAEFK